LVFLCQSRYSTAHNKLFGEVREGFSRATQN
jgi:hypothetical protein